MTSSFKKIIFLFCLTGFILSCFFLFFDIVRAEDAKLEVVYPEIPDIPNPTTVKSGLPSYVKYIFWFAVAIIGLIALGVFIYSGFEYLTSFGNPGKFSEAKDKMISAGLGIIILLAAYLIFNTINPELTILSIPEPTIFAPTIQPGIYLCNYKVSNEQDLFNNINNYINGENNQIIIDAAKYIKEVMTKSETEHCERLESSGNFRNPFKLKENTIFIIPRKEYVNEGIKWKYDYGVIFHEKDNFRGECFLKSIYNGNQDLSIIEPLNPDGSNDLNKVYSATLFTIPDSKTSMGQKGVILYQCKNYNQPGGCPEEVTSPLSNSFRPFGAETYVLYKKNDLSGENGNGSLAENTYSIKIDQPGYFFGVLFSDDNFKGNCEVITEDDIDLTNNPIGQCGCEWWRPWSKCKSCLNSMVVIEGKVVK